MINFNYVSSPVTSGDIDEIGLRFGFNFPEEFRQLYLRSNGGRPTRNVFVDNNGSCVVDSFLPIKYPGQTRVTLEECIRLLKVEQRTIPDHLVPFATDSFGNFYCFSVQAADYGAIYWLKMEGKRKSSGDFLSRSLDSFLGSLKTRAEALPAK